jgi:large subunit ribosomal protein L13
MPRRSASRATKLRQKSYFRHSNYPGGLREESLGALLERKPELVIERAVKGMLPQNRLGRAMFRKLKVYRGADHPTRPSSRRLRAVAGRHR